ncbi:MAG: hypothetical protein ACP5N9_06485 [Candidatus Bilamarchaeum sp.]
MSSEQLSEDQKALLQKLEPFDEVLSQVEESAIFRLYALNSLSQIKTIEQKIQLIKTALKKEKVQFAGRCQFTFNIIQIIKQDRATGFDFLCDLLADGNWDQLDEFYLYDEINPLSESEIRKIVSVFESLEMKSYPNIKITILSGAKFFLSKACTKNFLPLLVCMHEWIGTEQKFYFVIDLCREISKDIFDSKFDRSEERNQLVDLIANDLAKKKIKFDKKSHQSLVKDKFSDYVNYLLSQYSISQFNKDKICSGYKNRTVVSAFLPKLQTQFENSDFKHPLAAYFDNEKSPDEARETINAAMQADWNARNATWTLISLWDFEENLVALEKQPAIKPEVRDRLYNATQFEDTLSELSVSRLLNQIGHFELLRNEELIEGRFQRGNETINVEVARPQMDPKLEYGQGGSMHPFSKASKIADKAKKIKKLTTGSTLPFLIILDASRSNINETNIENYILGVQKFFYRVEKKTGKIVEQGFFNDLHDPNYVGLSEEDAKVVSAVLIYRRNITIFGIDYAAKLVPNPKAEHPISEGSMNAIFSTFNKSVPCPLLLKPK